MNAALFLPCALRGYRTNDACGLWQQPGFGKVVCNRCSLRSRSLPGRSAYYSILDSPLPPEDKIPLLTQLHEIELQEARKDAALTKAQNEAAVARKEVEVVEARKEAEVVEARKEKEVVEAQKEVVEARMEVVEARKEKEVVEARMEVAKMENRLVSERLAVTKAEGLRFRGKLHSRGVIGKIVVSPKLRLCFAPAYTWSTLIVLPRHAKAPIAASTACAETVEESFRIMQPLHGVGDRRKLWVKALKLPENSKLLACMSPHVRVAKNATDDAVVEEIARQMVAIHKQLSEQLHPRLSEGDIVAVDASHLGPSNAQLVRCVASSLYLQCQIINDVSVDKGWDDLTKGDESQSESSIDEGSS